MTSSEKHRDGHGGSPEKWAREMLRSWIRRRIDANCFGLGRPVWPLFWQVGEAGTGDGALSGFCLMLSKFVLLTWYRRTRSLIDVKRDSSLIGRRPSSSTDFTLLFLLLSRDTPVTPCDTAKIKSEILQYLPRYLTYYYTHASSNAPFFSPPPPLAIRSKKPFLLISDTFSSLRFTPIIP